MSGVYFVTAKCEAEFIRKVLQRRFPNISFTVLEAEFSTKLCAVPLDGLDLSGGTRQDIMDAISVTSLAYNVALQEGLEVA